MHKISMYAAWLAMVPLLWAGEPGIKCDLLAITPDKERLGLGCSWEYHNADVEVWFELMEQKSITKPSSAWELVPSCSCEWHPRHVPCPSCPQNIDKVEVSDIGEWLIKVTQPGTHALGITLRNSIFASLGYHYPLTQQQQESLAAMHTEFDLIMRDRTQMLCFDRYIRQVRTTHMRQERVRVDWAFSWREWCNSRPTTQAEHVECTAMAATGRVMWHTFPAYQHAPGQPPCGGVPVSNPDLWNGVREKPCSPDVCTPPPAPATPACGCASAL